jgi:hypothetical protein
MTMVTSKLFVRLLLPLLVVSLALGGLLASCQPTTETVVQAQTDEACPVPIKEDEPMSTSEKETVALKQTGIPPIDTVVPQHLETATFSLG